MSCRAQKLVFVYKCCIGWRSNDMLWWSYAFTLEHSLISYNSSSQPNTSNVYRYILRYIRQHLLARFCGLQLHMGSLKWQQIEVIEWSFIYESRQYIWLYVLFKLLLMKSTINVDVDLMILISMLILFDSIYFFKYHTIDKMKYITLFG